MSQLTPEIAQGAADRNSRTAPRPINTRSLADWETCINKNEEVPSELVASGVRETFQD